MPTGGGTEPPGTAEAPTVFFPRRALRSIFGFFCSDIESPGQGWLAQIPHGKRTEAGANLTAVHPFGKFEFKNSRATEPCAKRVMGRELQQDRTVRVRRHLKLECFDCERRSA